MMARGFFELNLVEADVGGDVFESVGAEVAEEADFALAVFGFADGDEVDPAVVVVVEGGDAEGASPVGRGQVRRARSLPWSLRQRVDSGSPNE